MGQKTHKATRVKKASGAMRSCIACLGQQFEPYGNLLLKCKECGLAIAKKIPTFEQLSELYGRKYFFGQEYSDYRADRPALEKNFRQRIAFLDPYLSKKSKVVEVGSAYGYFLNLIKDNVAWHKGFDVSQEGIKYSKKQLGIHATTTDFLLDKEIKPASIDLVCMWDLIEHLIEPQKYVKKTAEILKPGGALSLTTGDISSFMARKRGVNWRMIHPPTHVFYFSPKSIERLLARHKLEVTSVRHKSIYRNTGSVFNQLIVNRKSQKKNAGLLEAGHKLATATGLHKLNIPLNLYDIMEVTAVKSA